MAKKMTEEKQVNVEKRRTNFELRERRPNRDETWLDVQGRALYQAERMLEGACRAASVI